MSFDLVALKDERAAAPGARPRRSLDLETESVVRVLPIRWRLLSIAALNATVAVILAALIWNGANVLSRAWDEVRKVRESDKLLVQLESEASRLQNLIHRYINQPSQEVLTEILGLHGEVLSTLRNRGAVDPVLSGSADELRSVTERFLQGFGEVREVQTTIAHTYENEVLKPAKEMAGLYAIIEGAIGRRDALLLPSLGKSREAFTAGLVAANAFYLSLASDAADDARRNITTVEQTIPVMIDLAENSLQRTALMALSQRAASFRDGLKTLSEQFATRTSLLKTAIDDNQAAMIAVINKLSAQMTLRELQAQGSFDHTLADIYQNVALVAVIFLTVIVVIGALIARSIILPLKEIMAAMHSVGRGEIRPADRRDAGPRRDRRDGARGRGVSRERHRQAQGRQRAAGLEGARGEGARRPARGAAEPHRRREARGARRPRRRRRARGQQSDRHQPHGGVELRAALRRLRQGGRARVRCGARGSTSSSRAGATPPTSWCRTSSARASWCSRSSRSRSTAATPTGARSTCGNRPTRSSPACARC